MSQDKSITVQNKEVYINGRFLTQSITGVQRYAWELVKKLDDLLSLEDTGGNSKTITLLIPRYAEFNINFKNISSKQVGYLKGHAWEQIELPFYSMGGLLLSLCNTGPLIKSNQVVTIHDASVFAYPHAYSFAFRTWYKALFLSFRRLVRSIITVSSFSKSELVRYCHYDDADVHVVHHGSEHIFSNPSDHSILQENNIGNRPFVLAASSMNPNKNFHAVVRAVKILGKGNFDIVITGGANPKVFSQTHEPMPDHVKHIGYVSDGQLRALYERAACFIYPSFYEGFGLPPLEAMACGCPAIVSNVASLPEVCGDAALYCNPYSVEDIAEKIRMLINNVSLREELRQKGYEHAKQFTWEKCASQTIAVIERILSK